MKSLTLAAVRATGTLCLVAGLWLGTVPSAWAQSKDVSAHDAWVREPAASRNVTAMFVVLENSGGAERSVVSVSTDAAEKAELHEMKMANGMMSMSPVKAIPVPAHGKAELKPGGLHVMLFGLKGQPVAGQSLTLTLTLDDGTKVPVSATVRRMEMKQ